MNRITTILASMITGLALTVGLSGTASAATNPTLCAQARANTNITNMFISAYVNAQTGLPVDSQRYRDLQAAINALSAGLPVFAAAELKYC